MVASKRFSGIAQWPTCSSVCSESTARGRRLFLLSLFKIRLEEAFSCTSFSFCFAFCWME